MLRLLRRTHLGEAITIALDDAAYLRCKLVQCLAEELGITSLFLPGYSLNLNLIELMWKFVKKRSRNNCSMKCSKISSLASTRLFERN